MRVPEAQPIALKSCLKTVTSRTLRLQRGSDGFLYTPRISIARSPAEAYVDKHVLVPLLFLFLSTLDISAGEMSLPNVIF
jgi:hypothetical protein